jgi:hypothetical protein
MITTDEKTFQPS